MKIHIRPETKDDIRKIWRINASAFDTEDAKKIREGAALAQFVAIEGVE
ncbi:MAG: hypothetical protein PVG69_08845 [Desulfobacterales bacterium]|jgi:predicted N-acetyltransferase YhbS